MKNTMKKKNAKRETRMKIQTKIATAAKRDKSAALALALYGHDGETVSKKLSSQMEPAAFRPLNEAGMSQFIQDWLFIGESRNESWLKKQRQADPASFALRQEHLEIETHQLFGDRIEAGDWKFFETFAKTLKAEIEFREAATHKNRDAIHAELLAANLSGEKADLSKMADEIAEKEYPLSRAPLKKTDRLAWQRRKDEKRKNIFSSLKRTAKRIGIKAVSAKRGRPPGK